MMRIDVLLVLVCGSLALALRPDRPGDPFACPAPAADLAADASDRSPDVPDDLSSADWSGIREAYEANRHAVLADEGGHGARNPGQEWHSRFDGRGVTVQPDARGWEWGLQLERYGFAGEERAVSQPAQVSAAGQRMVYVWDGILEEWYVNDARGLEHGFTVHLRPPLDGRNGAGSLTFTLAVRGCLRPEIQADGRGVCFASSDGAAVLTYSGLTVLDADRRELPARFERVTEGLLLSIDERGGRYPLTIDPIAQQAYLKASNTGAEDFFGLSVAVSGDTVVVGATGEDSSATGVNGDQSNNGAMNSGAVYVFVRNGTTWSQQAYIKASNTDAADHFGVSVALSGDTLLVGATGEDSNATGVNGDQADNSADASGAAYVFVRNGASWTQQAYLKGSNTERIDLFGSPAAISGDTIAITAVNESSNAIGVNGDETNNALPFAGAVYVFVRSGTSWSQQAYIKASNTERYDEFGVAIALSGDVLIVGADGEDSNATGVNGAQGNHPLGDAAGAAYVFRRSGSTWSQEAYLKASNTEDKDMFGSSVAVIENLVLVGARLEDSNSGGVNGNQSNNSARESGAVYAFVRDETGWSQEAYVKASNPGAADSFGSSMSAYGNTVLIGAPYEASSSTGVGGDQSSNSALYAGAAYLFERIDGSWIQRAYVKASNTDSSDNFGRAVAISGSLAVVGATGESSNATGVNGNQADDSTVSSGAAYVFEIHKALVAFRNGGSNPASYSADPIAIGSAFTATVDNNLASQVASLLFAFDSAISLPLGGGQTLLCLDLGSGELFTGGNLAPTSSAGGVDSYSLAVPNDPGLCGFAFASQAIQFGSPPFDLSNAQDFTIGGP